MKIQLEIDDYANDIAKEFAAMEGNDINTFLANALEGAIMIMKDVQD